MTVKRNALIRAGATAVLAAAFGTGSMTSAAAASGPGSPGTMIEVMGTGFASAAPNEMTFTACASTQASTVSAALEANNAVSSKVKATLSKSGIADADVQTSSFSIGPDYNYGAQQNSQPTIVGYRIQHCVVSTLRDLSKDAMVLDAVAAAGGNDIQISSVQFDVSDASQLEQQARDDAYNDAYAKVMQDSANAGLTTCIPDTVADNSVSSKIRPTLGSADALQSVPLSEGQITRQVTISLAERCY